MAHAPLIFPIRHLPAHTLSPSTPPIAMEHPVVAAPLRICSPESRAAIAMPAHRNRVLGDGGGRRWSRLRLLHVTTGGASYYNRRLWLLQAGGRAGPVTARCYTPAMAFCYSFLSRKVQRASAEAGTSHRQSCNRHLQKLQRQWLGATTESWNQRHRLLQPCIYFAGTGR